MYYYVLCIMYKDDQPHAAPTGNTSLLKNDIRPQNLLNMMMKAADFSNL